MALDYDYEALSDAVITLHELARVIERKVGEGNLSQDIRNCANRVNSLLKERVQS